MREQGGRLVTRVGLFHGRHIVKPQFSHPVEGPLLAMVDSRILTIPPDPGQSPDEKRMVVMPVPDEFIPGERRFLLDDRNYLDHDFTDITRA